MSHLIYQGSECQNIKHIKKNEKEKAFWSPVADRDHSAFVYMLLSDGYIRQYSLSCYVIDCNLTPQASQAHCYVWLYYKENKLGCTAE